MPNYFNGEFTALQDEQQIAGAHFDGIYVLTASRADGYDVQYY